MPAPKLQRWIDLLAALLRRRFPATFEELAREVPAYANPRQARNARERMFERDKDELRAFGIPIRSEVSSDQETHGYKLAAQDFYLPYLSLVSAAGITRPRAIDRDGFRALKHLAFDPDELQAVAEAAARVAQLADPLLVDDARSAMRKLAFDLPADAVRPPDDAPHVDTTDRAIPPATFAALGDALVRRKTVTFEYFAIGANATGTRTLDPYGLSFLGGHWYLTGRDHDRDGALRTFRVSRISAPKVNAKRAQTPDYDIPADFHLEAHARSRATWELGDAPAADAIVDFTVRDGATAAAAKLGEPVGAPDAQRTRRRFRVRRRDAFARWLLSFAGDAVPVEPRELVEEWRALAAATLASCAPNATRAGSAPGAAPARTT